MRPKMTVVMVAAALLLATGYTAAQSLSGTVQYSGSQGPVSDSHPIRLFLFQNDPLQEGGGNSNDVDQAVVNENGGSFTLTAPASGNYFLGFELDVIPNDPDNSVNVGEPFQFYNRRFAAPADAIAVPQAGLSLEFDDTARLPGIAGTITYTGSQGPVSDARTLRLEVFSDPSLTDMMNDRTVATNGGHYDLILFDTVPRYLRAWLDVNGNGQFDPDEPFEVYNGKGATPGDPVVPGPDQEAVNFRFGDPTTAACVGDCDGSGDVTVNEIIVLVNIDLGTADASACPNGIPSGEAVDITLIVKAVGYALASCPIS